MLKLIDVFLHLMLLVIPLFLSHGGVFLVPSLLILEFLLVVLDHLIESLLRAVLLLDDPALQALPLLLIVNLQLGQLLLTLGLHFLHGFLEFVGFVLEFTLQVEEL